MKTADPDAPVEPPRWILELRLTETEMTKLLAALEIAWTKTLGLGGDAFSALHKRIKTERNEIL